MFDLLQKEYGYNNLEIEKEYKIENAPVKEDNPETGDKIIYTFIGFIISLSMIILIIIKIKKYTKN